MKKGLFDECPQIEVVPPSKKGKWLLAIFGALKEKRLVEITKAATTMLALPAPPVQMFHQETQTRTQRVQAAAPSGVAPIQPIVHVAYPRMQIEFLGGAATQDRAIGLINQSFPSEPIHLIAYTFDYGPLVVALCAARENSPRRLIEVVLDKASTKTGPAKQQNPSARQLLNAGIEVRLSIGKLLTPIYAEAVRREKLGSLVGIQHAKSISVGNIKFIGSTNLTVSSRANHEWSVCFPMDEEMTGRYVEYFGACWGNAKAVTCEELVYDMNDRTRVAALKMKH